MLQIYDIDINNLLTIQNLLKFVFSSQLLVGGTFSKAITAFIILIAAFVYFIGICIFNVFDENDLKFMPGGKKIEKLLKKAFKTLYFSGKICYNIDVSE